MNLVSALELDPSLVKSLKKRRKMGGRAELASSCRDSYAKNGVSSKHFPKSSQDCDDDCNDFVAPGTGPLNDGQVCVSAGEGG